ncbi:hypothetical protein [Sinorhizobium meliloti]|uniref:hypothetical protein n=1 Tax=Rhizobium meliloti TaxID=382 RepID=UPI00036924FE|nr:hypothetical protein [Sinorhizobium meliloti]
MVELAANIWADGPSSDPYEPDKAQIREWGTWVEGIITAFTSNGGLIYSSKAAMDADLAHSANSMAWVVGDPVVANNGVYMKIGASGSGSWVRVADLPYPFIPASDVGAGAPNAIQATTSIPVSESALIWVDLFEANDGSPVTISFNGGAALTIKTNANNDPVAGGLSGVLLGRISGTTFRLVSDQASAAIVAQVESWALIAQAAANNNLAFPTRAAAAAANIAASIHMITLHGDLSEGDGEGGPFRDTNNGSPDTFVSADGRTWYRVADIGFGRINIGAQPGPKSIEYFNSSLSRCSTGNHTVDFNALQAGLNSEYAVDIGGQKLEIEDTIVITKQESMLMSSITHQRNGSGDVRRAGNIRVEDNALPVLFDVRTYNARFDGIRINCLSTNTTTRHFNFSRPTNVNDVDASIKRCVFEYGLSVLRTYGRGMQVNDCEVVGTSDMAFELEWNPSWVSNGQSNDQNGTAQRGYTFTQIRQHGCKGLVKNTGAFRKQIADILISDIQGDTGGMLFEGVLKRSLVQNIQSHIHPVSAFQLDLWGGSEYSKINNFNFGGFNNGTTIRTPTTSIWMRPEQGADGGIIGVSLNGGIIGPTKSYGMVITGGGVVDVSLNDVHFIDTAYQTQTVAIVLSQPGDGSQVIEDFALTLDNCRFRQKLTPTSAKTSIVGGTSTSLSKVYIAGTTRQVGMSVPWVSGSIQNIAA